MSVYTDCMKPYMKGGGEDRKLRFCIGAKLCSGKEKDENKARQTCLTEPPKEPTGATGGKRPGRNCNVNMAGLAACAIDKIDWDVITQDTFEKHLSAALQECQCGKVRRARRVPPSMPKGVPKQMLAQPEAPGQHWSRA